MKCLNKILIILLLSIVNVTLYAQNNIIENYNRSSVYSLAMLHAGTAMYEKIHLTYWNLNSPEKYNDHDLSLKVLIAPDAKTEKEDVLKSINEFLIKNQIAKRMVSKWFNRNKADGSFNVLLIQERGNYNASQSDIEQALQTKRGKAMLADAGEQLIGNTFVIINDISYVNKEEKSQNAAAFFAILGAVAGAAGGSVGSLTASVSKLGGYISNTIAGFAVDIKSHLYQLKWNDEIANTFYQKYYFDKTSIDSTKKADYEKDKDLFSLEYVGSYSSRSAKTVMKGVHNSEEVFKKVLSRAIDNNIVELQKEYEVFKVTVPIYSIDNNLFQIQIGLKEGVSDKSRYEVLERVEKEDGSISYQRKGIIKPVKNLIWDNRYMAVEEEADGANFKYTTFEKVSGGDFYPGMLVREIKYTSGM